MNLSTVVKRCKRKLGLVVVSSIIEDIDDTIIEILQDTTIPTFSIYCPFKETMHFNMNDLELLDKEANYQKLLLPDFKTKKLLYVFDVRYRAVGISGFECFGGGFPLMSGDMLQQTIVAQANSNLAGLMVPKLSFRYEDPRVLYIYNAYASCNLEIDMGFEHDKSMASIPESCREEFIKLALLDVKENLYPTLKYYSEINTSFGNINLKIDDWANAEDQRAQYIEKLDETSTYAFPAEYYG